MKKILLTLMIGMFFISFVSGAIQTLGTFKIGEDINLVQTCISCSFNNISAITYPNSSFILQEETSMDNIGASYNYTLDSSNINTIGEYIVQGHGDLEGTDTDWTYNFYVTPSGNSGNSNIAFFILIILLIYGINLLGFFNENVMMTVLGGMALLFLGVYLINNGIIIYRDNLTNYVGYITIAWGGMSSTFALFKEYFDD